MSGKGMNWRRAGWATKKRDHGSVNVKDESDRSERDRAARWLDRRASAPAPAPSRPKPEAPNRYAGNGDPCPRCGIPMQVRKHGHIGDKQLRQPFYYAQWFYCANPNCRTKLVMPERFKVMNPVMWSDRWPDDEPGANEPPPWE
jgi:hypothetical protein